MIFYDFKKYLVYGTHYSDIAGKCWPNTGRNLYTESFCFKEEDKDSYNILKAGGLENYAKRWENVKCPIDDIESIKKYEETMKREEMRKIEEEEKENFLTNLVAGVFAVVSTYVAGDSYFSLFPRIV